MTTINKMPWQNDIVTDIYYTQDTIEDLSSRREELS
jgi:hypothetical protein